MATNRRLFLIFVALAIAFAAFSIAWMSSLSPGITSIHYLTITDAQFDKVYLTITVKNNGTCGTTISEVAIQQNSTTYIVPMNEFSIAGGDEIPMRISRESFNCTSGYTYQIRLTTTFNVSFFRTVVAP